MRMNQNLNERVALIPRRAFLNDKLQRDGKGAGLAIRAVRYTILVTQSSFIRA
jgi:hypothetical protein